MVKIEDTPVENIKGEAKMNEKLNILTHPIKIIQDQRSMEFLISNSI
jgi:hypothetical protein